MKKLLLLILLTVVISGCQDSYVQESQSMNEKSLVTRAVDFNDYYYGSKGKIPITMSSEKVYVLFKGNDAELQKTFQKANITTINDARDFNLIVPHDEKNATLFANLKSGIGNIADLANMTKLDEVVYAAPYYIFSDGGKEYPLTNIFYVELLSPEDIVKLEKIAADNNVTIVHKISLTENAYTLSCTKESKGNALEMANLFYETGMFLSSTPEFLAIEDACVNDDEFGLQWNLRNTGQSGGTVGIDIDYCNARAITTGSSNITIAVIDRGAPVNHDDLNIYRHYDAISRTNISNIVNDHGTQVIGIINAPANNSEGIAGIAPGCKLLSISHNATVDVLVHALRYAADEEAHVINCSWGGNVDNSTLNSAVRYAIQKGCVVVFASGNDGPGNGQTVDYPGAAVPEALVVGSITQTGSLSSFSSYGSALDVVAPGSGIRTTYHTGGYITNSGTSLAAPHVSGIAALLLSTNPNLTQSQVASAIIQSANRPSKNNEYGYGLVNAVKALFYDRLTITGSAAPATLTNVSYSTQSSLPGATFQNWTVTPSTGVTISNPNSPTATFRFTHSNIYYIEANYTLPGNASYSTSKMISSYVAAPVIPVIHAESPGDEISLGVMPGDVFILRIDNYYGSGYYEWDLTGLTQTSYNGNAITVTVAPNPNSTLTTVSARCRLRYGNSQYTAWSNTISADYR